MSWIEFLPVIIPSVVAFALAIVTYVLKMQKNSLQGMAKEASELLVAVVESARDKHFTQEEILRIIREGEDVIEEAKKLLLTK